MKLHNENCSDAFSTTTPCASNRCQRLYLRIRGAVQGVGFRPFVYRLAHELALDGWVKNSSQGVFIEVEGPTLRLQEFTVRLRREKPPRAILQSIEASYLDPAGHSRFQILESEEAGQEKTALILPDIATCSECLQDILTPGNRRYLYPFTNCTNCGPRYSIIQALPYDRDNTSMWQFKMCPACQAEYDNPLDRRFHAQPNACPQCGPQLELWDLKANCQARYHEALLAVAEKIRQGEIIAIKGLGGFHLVVDARNDDAVQRLRRRKQREEKPFALMFPGLDALRKTCQVSTLEEDLLLSPESPIVLLHRKTDSPEPLAPSVAPCNPWLGAMLPYTPIHHLLMRELNFPIVATSGNLSDEPICTYEREAAVRLAQIADGFLIHNRPIAHHVDDSIARIVVGRELVLRRARGYAPLPISLPYSGPPALALGAHLKNTIAVGLNTDGFVSQHIGDMETPQAFTSFREVIDCFQTLYKFAPTQVACDLHPDYLSTRFALEQKYHLTRIQHHFAHILSCMAENQLEGELLGVAWDGTGYGLDQTIWGGEFLKITKEGFDRLAHFRHFPLPGNEKAIKEPRRSALGILYEVYNDAVFEQTDLAPIQAFIHQKHQPLLAALSHHVNSPRTSSAGRLFDAVASLCGLQQKSRFEGQAAMALEFACEGIQTDEAYPIECSGRPGLPMIINWAPTVIALLADLRARVPVGLISARFHNAMVTGILQVAERAGSEKVVMSGGCFQNRYLLETAVHRLRNAGFRPYWHQRIPPNDGGISLGQLFALRWMYRDSR
jgi:hydrogenase maturation protein HypF